jgi:1-deoxyxylulose-5-phosphate synthase
MSLFQPRRELGRTGFQASVLGIGDLADRKLPLSTLVETIHRAMDAGLNLIDTAPAYEDGYSEEVVGAALKGRRSGMFVIDKIDHHDKPVAPQVEGSLRRLGLSEVDLLVFHGVSDLETWHKLSGRNGGLAQLDACVKGGKARFKGVSSHNPDVLKIAIESRWCDVVMFAVGPYVDERFTNDILPMAKRLHVGTVCFKTFGSGKLVADTSGYNEPLPPGTTISGTRLTVSECVSYTLTHDPDVTLLGLSHPHEQAEAFAAASAFRHLTPARMADIRRRAADAVRGKGECWWNPVG